VSILESWWFLKMFENNLWYDFLAIEVSTSYFMSLILERKDSKAKAPNFMIFGSSGFEKSC
jgi:hypothetical protein